MQIVHTIYSQICCFYLYLYKLNLNLHVCKVIYHTLIDLCYHFFHFFMSFCVTCIKQGNQYPRGMKIHLPYSYIHGDVGVNWENGHLYARNYCTLGSQQTTPICMRLYETTPICITLIFKILQFASHWPDVLSVLPYNLPIA